jgi:sugar phosphate isomerase/epimerase
MLTLVNNVDSPFLRLTLDNYMLPSDWAVAAYQLLAPKAAHVHLSTPRWGDRVGANRNKFRFKEFVRILKRNNYDGYLMIEWRSPNRPVEKLMNGLVGTKKMLEDLISSA